MNWNFRRTCRRRIPTRHTARVPRPKFRARWLRRRWSAIRNPRTGSTGRARFGPISVKILTGFRRKHFVIRHESASEIVRFLSIQILSGHVRGAIVNSGKPDDCGLTAYDYGKSLPGKYAFSLHHGEVQEIARKLSAYEVSQAPDSRRVSRRILTAFTRSNKARALIVVENARNRTTGARSSRTAACCVGCENRAASGVEDSTGQRQQIWEGKAGPKQGLSPSGD